MSLNICDPAAVAGAMDAYRATLRRYAGQPLPRVEQWQMRYAVGVTLLALIVVGILSAILLKVAIPERRPSLPIVVSLLIGVPIVCGAAAWISAGYHDRKRAAAREAYVEAAHSLGLTYIGERRVEDRSCLGSLPLLHFEEHLPTATVVMGGNVQQREVFVVECTQIVDFTITAPKLVQALDKVASAVEENDNTRARSLCAIIIPNVHAADILLLSEKDIESKYCRKLLPKELHFDELAPQGFLLAALNRGTARLLAPVLSEHAHGAPELCVQMLSGHLVVWRHFWISPRETKPNPHSRQTVENVQLALALATKLEKAGERTSGEVKLL